MTAAKAHYHTHQREELLAFMKDHPGRHVTAAEVCSHFQQLGKPIGTATIYRQLDRLTAEGMLRKYIIDSGSPACYAYIGEEQCLEGTCFHCKCMRCGRLIHMKCEELEGIGQHLMEHHHFELDPMRTVFYGVCEDCQGKVRSAGKE